MSIGSQQVSGLEPSSGQEEVRPRDDHKLHVMSPHEHLEWYLKLIQHENSLMNYRFFWGVFVNAGFLTLVATKGLAAPFNSPAARVLLVLVAMGWNLAIAIMCSLALAAEAESLRAIDALLRTWRIPGLRKSGIRRLRTVRGGGSKCRHYTALGCEIVVFWMLPVFWGVVFLAMVL